MRAIFSFLSAAAILSLAAGCGAYRSGNWPRLNYDDTGPPALDSEASASKPSLPPPPPGAVKPAPALADLTADFSRLSDDSEAQLARLDQAQAALDGGDDDARRRAWLALQLELSRLNRLRGELTGLINSGDELAERSSAQTDELRVLLGRMDDLNARLTIASQQAERRLKDAGSS